MNAVFNVERYLKLEKRNLFFSKMHYTYILGGLIALYLLSMLTKILADASLSALIYLVAFVVIVAGPCLFEKSRNKHSSIFDFILPASTFEKFLSIWLKYVVIIPLSIFLLFFILNTITGFIAVDAIKEHAHSMSLNQLTGGTKAFFFVFGTQAAFLGGYFYFRRYAFAKTSVLLLLIMIVIVILGIFVGAYFFKGQELSFNLNSNMSNNSYDMGYNMGMTISSFINDRLLKTLDIIIDTVFVVGMWIVCFFKLRETEI